MDLAKRELAVAFHNLGVVKFGEFRLKSGVLSPVYVDMRLAISVPSLLENLADCICPLVRKPDSSENILVCGIPYSALPLATCVSTKSSIPMVLCRKESKTYGTKQLVEGHWDLGQPCVLIEDVVTSGSSVAATAQLLRSEGICVPRAVTVVNREQGGTETLSSKHKIALSSLFTLTELVQILAEEGCICEPTAKFVLDYIHSNSETTSPLNSQLQCLQQMDTPPLSTSSDHQSLETIIANKQTRLCVALDVTNADRLLELADQLGPKVCAIKLHLDLIRSNSNPQSVVTRLRQLATQHGFYIIEDRKLADIGETVLHQLLDGVFQFGRWCDLVTVHCLSGPGIFDAFRALNRRLADEGHSHCVRALPVAQMSSKGNLLTPAYTERCVTLCEDYADVLGGFVSQHPLPGSNSIFVNNPSLFYWVPGVQLDAVGDTLGQKYSRPDHVLKRFEFESRGSSNVILIVGRGITEATDPIAMAERYRHDSWI